jgi:hypothetical protein
VCWGELVISKSRCSTPTYTPTLVEPSIPTQHPAGPCPCASRLHPPIHPLAVQTAWRPSCCCCCTHCPVWVKLKRQQRVSLLSSASALPAVQLYRSRFHPLPTLWHCIPSPYFLRPSRRHHLRAPKKRRTNPRLGFHSTLCVAAAVPGPPSFCRCCVTGPPTPSEARQRELPTLARRNAVLGPVV